MCVCLGWLIDVDGDLALINPTRPIIKGEFGQDPKEGCKENLRPTLKLVAPVPSPSFPLRYWSSKALKILRYCNITIPYSTYKTFQTLIKSPNIHKWGETFQIPRHRSKWPNKNCSHHKGGGERHFKTHIWRLTSPQIRRLMMKAWIIWMKIPQYWCWRKKELIGSHLPSLKPQLSWRTGHGKEDQDH